MSIPALLPPACRVGGKEGRSSERPRPSSAPGCQECVASRESLDDAWDTLVATLSQHRKLNQSKAARRALAKTMHRPLRGSDALPSLAPFPCHSLPAQCKLPSRPICDDCDATHLLFPMSQLAVLANISVRRSCGLAGQKSFYNLPSYPRLNRSNPPRQALHCLYNLHQDN